MIFIVGAKGFLGSSLANACREQGWEYTGIDQEEYADYVGRECDILINANGNSRKYLAREAPLEDFAMNVTSVRRSLEDFRYGKYVLFSSADVYPDSSSPATTDEKIALDPARQTPYGFHKYLAEQCVRHRATRWLILRLSGFVGPGLTKNAVHDVLSSNPLWVDAASEFQYLHTSDLASMVLGLAASRASDGETVNVGAQGTMSVAELSRLTGRALHVRPGSPRVRCEIALARLARFCEIPTTRAAVQRFLDESARKAKCVQ
jgi:nucleoside-diphosphate-sugar epimerase